jgi:hypothetical protein
LKGQFLRHIQLNINAFNKYYKKTADNIPSGNCCTVDAKMERAIADYQDDNKKPFCFSACVPIYMLFPNLIQWLPQLLMTTNQNSPALWVVHYSVQWEIKQPGY